MALPLTYHWRHLLVRRTTSLLTMAVVAAVVAALTWILGFAFALRTSLAVARDDHKLMVLRRGSTSESTSAIPVADYNKLTQVTGVARDPNTAAPLISPEMIVQVSLPRQRDGGRTSANVAVRGVTPIALQVHRSVHLTGPLFATGTQEIIVGAKAAAQFMGLQLGDVVNLGFGNDRGYKVVGYFTADGGPLESEIWGYLPSLLNAYNRSMYSSAALRLAPDADPAAVIQQISGPAIQLDAQTEAEYWNGQTGRVRAYLGIVGALVLVMAVAAACSIANTMYALVAGRVREIAMLRTIGFSRRQILLGFVLEAVLLAVLGGAVGCAACALWLALAGRTKDMLGASSFATLAFEIRLTPMVVTVALVAVTLVGALGAFLPARRAARVEVITALREA
jgi:putative ABC transport system permease protein